MRKLFWLIIIISIIGYLLSDLVYAIPPSRDNEYVAGTVISPTNVMDNEDNLFEYLQDGVDTYSSGSIPTAALQDGAVTSAKIADGTITTSDLAFSVSNQILPSGAIFFMITGSCPAWTTDVSSTYASRFILVNATQGTQSGTTTHTHTSGTFAGASHTHSISSAGGSASGWDATINTSSSSSTDAAQLQHTHGAATGSGGGGAVSGTSASGDNIPPYVSAKLCQVN